MKVNSYVRAGFCGRWALVCLVAFLSLSGFRARADGPHAGLLYDEFELTLTPGHRTEVLGPLFYHQEQGPQRLWAFPPLVSYFRDPDTDYEEFDIGYPLFTYDRYGQSYRWQLGQLFSFAGGPTHTATNQNRFTIFPLYFQQRSSEPSQNYTAVLPFYGHLKRRLFRDEIFFVMFPFYGQSRKRDIVTDNYLYPLFHLRHGEGLSGWQFWPLVGSEHKDVTTRTNGFHEVETVAGHESRFILWPLYISQNAGLGTDNPSRERVSLPAFSLMRSPRRDVTTVLWPFFNWVDDREKKYREWELPWPLIVFARGEGKTTSRVLPFFSTTHTTNRESDSLLWPLYKYSHDVSAPLDRERRRVAFFLYSDSIDRNTETGLSRRRTEFLPLFDYRRDFNGNTRLQVLSPLEVFVLGSHKIERDYSPLWSLWLAQKNPRTGAASQSLLWNLYRHESAPNHKRLSLLFGLYQSESNPEGNRLRICYIPFGKKSPPPSAGVVSR